MIRRGLALTALVCCSAAAPAAADAGRLADFDLGLTTTRPGMPTGMRVHVFIHREGDPNAKPSPLRRAVIRGPSGLRFDTTTLTQCMASDDQIRALGTNACPPESKLAVGPFSAMSGFGPPVDPINGDTNVFNGPNQFIEIITPHDSSASPAVDRLTIDGSTLTAMPPRANGGPPDGEMAVRSVDFEIPARAANLKRLIATPPRCPADGQWTTTATFEFADGTSDTVLSRTPCEPPPRIRLRVRPRRVSAGRPVRVRFRVTSSSDACVRDARVKLAGRTVRVGSDGRAVLATRFTRSGLRRARVTSPGCAPTSVPVRIV